ncbi:hypothetical protein [Tenacibaculum sp. M341]|uniref:hypothetical protein n=1 Tax=Tenacibaculum sp. M341 TaxID=2530339 RepID=UPI001049E94C|nr:hypothetical protein [Tenacibaculum sp. M341]TCI94793.1 hypothetical protein EYW44_00290 [Tenacibaculum sp. M341]
MAILLFVLICTVLLWAVFKFVLKKEIKGTVRWLLMVPLVLILLMTVFYIIIFIVLYFSGGEEMELF